MPDREKYIELLSKTVKTMKEFNEDAPIKISLECIEDILELLKEQDAEIAFLKAMQLQTVRNMSNEDIGNAVRNVLRL